MPRNPARLSAGIRLADFISVGVIARTFPFAVVGKVLASCGKAGKRKRDLPGYLLVYYVIALALYVQASTREVLRCLLEGFRWLHGPEVLRVAGKSGISQARSRLGYEPLKKLFETAVRPLASEQTPGAFYRRWRLVAVDGSTLTLADTKENAEVFQYPGVSSGQAAYPLLRCIALVETGTHVVFAAASGSCRTGEETLLRQVLSSLRPGMLCMGDRNFFGYELWEEARATGADLLWRTRKRLNLPCLERFADGSYLSEAQPPPQRKKTGAKPIRIRVIDYRLQGAAEAEPFYRLVTTIDDYRQAPAEELARVYPERWEIETGIGEIKTDLGGSAAWVLRSKKPDLVRQEFYGLLLAHFLVRQLMQEAGVQAKEDTDRLSFVHAVRIVRRRISSPGAIPPSERRISS